MKATCENRLVVNGDPYVRTWQSGGGIKPCGRGAKVVRRGLSLCSYCDGRLCLSLLASTQTEAQLRARYAQRVTYIAHPLRRPAKGKPHYVLAIASMLP